MSLAAILQGISLNEAVNGTEDGLLTIQLHQHVTTYARAMNPASDCASLELFSVSLHCCTFRVFVCTYCMWWFLRAVVHIGKIMPV